eukprot:3907980-Lingulodinium_polyedra.AAC.1
MWPTCWTLCCAGRSLGAAARRARACMSGRWQRHARQRWRCSNYGRGTAASIATESWHGCYRQRCKQRCSVVTQGHGPGEPTWQRCGARWSSQRTSGVKTARACATLRSRRRRTCGTSARPAACGSGTA